MLTLNWIIKKLLHVFSVNLWHEVQGQDYRKPYFENGESTLEINKTADWPSNLVSFSVMEPKSLHRPVGDPELNENSHGQTWHGLKVGQYWVKTPNPNI